MDARLEHGTLKLKELIADYRNGRIVIPEFQREYVWKQSRAPKLIDSLYRGFPVSSLLLWVSDAEARARRAVPRQSRAAPVSWLIDGQQRVITLSRCASGNEGINVVFSPVTRSFRLANAATAKDPTWYALSDIWDDDAYLALRRGLSAARAAEHEREFEKVRAILDYEIPFVRMRDHGFDEAVEAFTRINTLGVRLKQEDIESAQAAAKHSGFIADRVTPFLRKMHQEGFTRLTVSHLFRTCAYLALPDGRSRTPLHELSTREVDAAWRKTERAAEATIGLVRSELGLFNMDILWTGALLVPPMVLCAQMGRSLRAKEVAAWIAAAALLKRYSKSSHTMLDQDLKACRRTDPIGALLTNIRSQESGVFAVEGDFKGSLNDRGGLLGAYIACRHRGAKDLFSGGNVLLQRNIHRHHILPRAQFPEQSRKQADAVANIAFITDQTNRAISMSGPEVYLERIPPDVLRTQCIPEDPALWRVDKAQEFFEERRQLLADSFNEFLKESLPGRRVG